MIRFILGIIIGAVCMLAFISLNLIEAKLGGYELKIVKVEGK